MRSKAKGPGPMAKVLPPKVPAAVRTQALTGATGARPTLPAYGGRCAYSGNREMRTVVYWITTVAAPSWPSSVLLRGGATHPAHRPGKDKGREGSSPASRGS